MTGAEAAPARNALAGSRSPFLRHGATQPVDWHPWGDEAFERARREKRPILLDIGAVWCHWCHVMDRESYENDDTASLINELFVPVTVDRDERPDVDARYQRAVQVLTGQGGWPLTAFLTPDGEVFYGGTYFPPNDAHGRPSFRRVLNEVARIWAEEPARAADAARGIRERTASYAAAEVDAGAVSEELVGIALDALADSYDVRHGGFGRAPKFPNAGGLDLLLDAWLDDGAAWTGRIVEETLTAMVRGGIYDQLGGGFHRYSTDARWIIPHFEKMATDNGVLATTLARAAVVFDSTRFDQAVRGIVEHYRDVAGDVVAAGGFPASQDADFGLDNDGDYWTWTVEELNDALGGDARLLRVAVLHFGVDDPAGSMHIDPARHVLFRQLDAADVAGQIDTDEAAARELIAEVRRRLKVTRDRRPRPFVDETLYAPQVALVAAGHLAAARHLGMADAGEAALRALDRIWRDGFAEGLGVAHRIGDRQTGEGLDDQAHFANTLIDAFEVTQDRSHLERAQQILDIAIARFTDETGAFRDRPVDVESDVAPLARPHYPLTDAPEPSGNGAIALALLRMHEITGETGWRERAERVLRAFAAAVPRFASSAATYVKAVARATLPVTRIVVVAEPGDEAGDALLTTALRVYRPRTLVLRIAPGEAASGLPPELDAMLSGAAPRAYVCAGRRCAAPVSAVAPLTALMREFRG